MGHHPIASPLHTPRYDAFRLLLIAKRKEAGLTQVAVADALGKPQSYVSKYEKGERRLDFIEYLDLARVIGFDPASFIGALTVDD